MDDKQIFFKYRPLGLFHFYDVWFEYRRARRKTNSAIAASSPHTQLRRVHQISAGSPQTEILKIFYKLNLNQQSVIVRSEIIRNIEI